MWENIKSSFFIKLFFSFLDEKTKLKLVKYNKSLQNIIDINLINYRILNGRYFVCEENGKGKEYSSYNDRLIFEGEYKNGKRNGKGKKYDYNGKLEYEGEYLNEKRNGKGKVYDIEGNLRFEGEYLNGNKNGKAKEYYKGRLIFDGKYLNGKKWNGKIYDDKKNIIYELKKGAGYIKEYDYFGKLEFEGEYLNGDRNGKGKEYDHTGKLRFEGKYKNGKRDGIGKEYYEGKLIFEGIYLNGNRWDGKVYDNKNNIYVLKNGTGLIKQYDEFGNLEIEENYENGKLNGKIKKYFNGKLKYEGEYLKGKLNGKKKIYKILSEKSMIENEYINGILLKGKEYNNDGELINESEFLYGWKRKGKSYIKGRLEFEGEYLFDRKYNGKGYDENGNIIYELINGNGKVKEYDRKERLIFDGEYLNGRRWNGIFKKFKFDGAILKEEYKNGEKI